MPPADELEIRERTLAHEAVIEQQRQRAAWADIMPASFLPFIDRSELIVVHVPLSPTTDRRQDPSSRA